MLTINTLQSSIYKSNTPRTVEQAPNGGAMQEATATTFFPTIAPAATTGLSLNALLYLSQGVSGNGSNSYYSSFFPSSRAGMDTNALAVAVTDPGAVSSSADKPFAEVATDARARMDTKYKTMTDSGLPFDAASFEGRDGNALMGDLDRRSLYAVASNEGNLFSEDEQALAESLMSQQQGLAIGIYSGPASQETSFSDPYAGSMQSRMAASIAYLDNVSAEEKLSTSWNIMRNAAQNFLDSASRDNDPGSIDNPGFVDELAKMYQQRRATEKASGNEAMSSADAVNQALTSYGMSSDRWL